MRDYTRKTAKDCLKRWAHEVAGGGGKANMLARLSSPGGSSDFEIPPGALFSPIADKTDRTLKDIRNLDLEMYKVLVATAMGLSLEDMVRNRYADSKSALHILQSGGLDALRFGLYLKRA